jgi:DNA-binding XRE family transcriptional regulator
MKRPVGMSGKTLKEIRERLGWSQETMASWLGVARNTVARMESGTLPVPVTTARLAILVQDEKNQQKILSAT